MPLQQTMYTNQYPINGYNQNQTQKYQYQQQAVPVPAAASAVSASFGPSQVLNIDTIRQQLGVHNLTEYEIIAMAKDAILHGFNHPNKVVINRQVCHQFLHQNMVFVLAEGFDAVVTIIWDSKPKLIGDRGTTFQRDANHQVMTNQQHIIHQQQPPQQTQYMPYIHNPHNPHYNKKVETLRINLDPVQPTNYDPDCADYECMIDEIVTDLFENDPDFASSDVLLPPLPPQQAAQSVTPITPNTNHLTTPTPVCLARDRMNLRDQSSFYSITDDNHSKLSGGDILEYQSSAEIKISDHLFNELRSRYPIQSKQELLALVETAIFNKAQVQYIGEDKQWMAWIDRYYVYITRTDQSTLIDMFEYNQFHSNFAQCYQSLMSRTSSPLPQHQISNNLSASYRGSKLVRNNSSKRSILSHSSSADLANNDVYRTIYIKPIIQRMKALTNLSSIDSDYIIEIVDQCIKKGSKRQISKRTFEFKWNSYTIIMSKSLKTILDVTISDDPQIITVHPDVVAIISKKCPVLDYFTIQKIAHCAKLNASFTTKKNDYRQQFIYDFCGCRIVFASNHTTIVEMQCNDAAAIKAKLINQ